MSTKPEIRTQKNHVHVTHTKEDPTMPTKKKSTTVENVAQAATPTSTPSEAVAGTASVTAAPATATPAPLATTSAAAASTAGIPSVDDVAKWTSLLDGVSAMLGALATPLTTQQRRRSLKLRKGGEPMVGLIAGLGTQYKVQLPGVDPQAMQNNILLAQRLQPLDTKLRAVAALVSDTVGNAKTQSWQGTTALYTALVRASAQTPALQTELRPAVEFFAKKGKKKDKSGEAPAKVTGAGAPPTVPAAAASGPSASASAAAAPATTASATPTVTK